ncbi:MAG TPA: GNAT family N-acetyltransferase [Anaerolineales bacterium]|jgi:RimJ/RimL family protein N-acetyltransferase
MRQTQDSDRQVLETERLRLRELTLDDAAFILTLLNEPAFIRFIGDKGVRTLADARNYLQKGPIASYDRFGYGLWLAQLKLSGEPLGVCGLVRRDTLPDADIGYAYLERYWSKGYATEAARGVMRHAFDVLGLKRLLAITDQENSGSIKVLKKIGLKDEGLVRLSDEGPELILFGLNEG